MIHAIATPPRRSAQRIAPLPERREDSIRSASALRNKMGASKRGSAQLGPGIRTAAGSRVLPSLRGCASPPHGVVAIEAGETRGREQSLAVQWSVPTGADCAWPGSPCVCAAMVRREVASACGLHQPTTRRLP